MDTKSKTFQNDLNEKVSLTKPWVGHFIYIFNEGKPN